jgi:MFS family permease
MTQFVVVIDASIVNVALPSIGRALNFSRTDFSWAVNSYTLTAAPNAHARDDTSIAGGAPTPRPQRHGRASVIRASRS